MIGASSHVTKQRPPPGPAPDFLIVGTPRSGTTLLQRLACELPGVSVPPETHFFVLFAPGLLNRRRFPLDRAALWQELQRYEALETSRELDLDLQAVLDDLEGSCDSVVELFGALVRHLAGPAGVRGEKTPGHLRWWRPLTRALPQLKVIALVRDPRAVVASNLAVPWGMKRPALLAEMWRHDQSLLGQARVELGPDRCLVLRYEDVVAEPEATRNLLAGFLNVGRQSGQADTPPATPPTRFVHSWEWWKQGVFGPVSTERVGAWRNRLSTVQAADVTAICRNEMQVFGYASSAPSMLSTAFHLARLGPADRWRRYRLQRVRRQQLEWIEGQSLQALPGGHAVFFQSASGVSA
ncbi:MAG: sulfotransferase [Actinomycetota bacterium]|nr:sulfotransferase [Actinomycetota bacterium]